MIQSIMLLSSQSRNKCQISLFKITQLKGPVKEPNMFHNYETEKITCNDHSDAAENLQL